MGKYGIEIRDLKAGSVVYKNYFELAGGSSYREFELPRVQITVNV